MKTDRRTFSRSMTLALAASAVPAWAQGRKNLAIGHTGITWPRGNPAAGGARAPVPAGDPGLVAPPPVPPSVDPKAIEQIFIDLSGFGYHGVGQEKVDLAAILTMLEGRAMDGMIMVELDGGRNMPMSALETATIAKAYLQKQGMPFRT